MDRVTKTVVYRSASSAGLQQLINDVEESGEGWGVHLITQNRNPTDGTVSTIIVYAQKQGVLF